MIVRGRDEACGFEVAVADDFAHFAKVPLIGVGDDVAERAGCACGDRGVGSAILTSVPPFGEHLSVDLIAGLSNSAKADKWRVLGQAGVAGPNPWRSRVTTRQRQRRLTSVEVDKLVGEYLCGVMRKQLAARYGIHSDTGRNPLTAQSTATSTLRPLDVQRIRFDPARS